MMNPLGQLFADQFGVVSRTQLHGIGMARSDVERMLRRRDLVRLMPGIYLNHTGQPTWIQRAWAGTLFYAPAALGKESALRVVHGPGWRSANDTGPITITVDEDRHVQSRPGYIVVRQVGFARRAVDGSPPRVRLEEAVLDVAAEQMTTMDSLEVIADACRSRRTTPKRLLETLRQRKRLKRREWLAAVLEDVGKGTHSVLEHDFVHLVERPHGLPPALYQVPRNATLGRRYDDVVFAPFGVSIELDGSLFHATSRQRDRDLDRDLDAAVAGRRTLRLGWGQVHGRSCLTAARLALVLQAHGWTGHPTPCGEGCPIGVQRAG